MRRGLRFRAWAILPLGLGLCLTACLGSEDEGGAGEPAPSTTAVDPASTGQLQGIASAPRVEHFAPARATDVGPAQVTRLEDGTEEIGSVEIVRGTFDAAAFRATEVFLARKVVRR